MSIQDLLHIGANITTALAGISSNIQYNQQLSTIPIWDGNPKLCENFIKAIEAAQNLPNVNNEALIRTAHIKTTGLAKSTVSNYIRTTEAAQQTWSGLKKILKETYGIPVDPSSALEKLRKFRQTNEMSLDIFAQLIEEKVDDAFPDSAKTDPLVQRELTTVFIKGLLNPKIRERLIIKNPTNLRDALTKAKTEFEIHSRIASFKDKSPVAHSTETPTRYEEPMDISHLQTYPTPHAQYEFNDFSPTPFQHDTQPTQFEENVQFPAAYSNPPHENLYTNSMEPHLDFQQIENDEQNVYAMSYNRKLCYICKSDRHLIKMCPHNRKSPGFNNQTSYRPRLYQPQAYRQYYQHYSVPTVPNSQHSNNNNNSRFWRPPRPRTQQYTVRYRAPPHVNTSNIRPTHHTNNTYKKQDF